MNYDSLVISLRSSTDLATSRAILDTWLSKVDKPPSHASLMSKLISIEPCASTIQLAENCLDCEEDKRLCFPLFLGLLELELPESNNILNRWLATNLRTPYIHLLLIECISINLDIFLPIMQTWISNNPQDESLPTVFNAILTSTTDQVILEWVWKWINIHPENPFNGTILHDLLIVNPVTDCVFGNDLVEFAKGWLLANPFDSNATGILAALVSAHADDAQFNKM